MHIAVTTMCMPSMTERRTQYTIQIRYCLT